MSLTASLAPVSMPTTLTADSASPNPSPTSELSSPRSLSSANLETASEVSVEQKTPGVRKVHILYDEGYQDWDIRDNLMTRFIKAGWPASNYYVNMSNLRDVLATIPRTDIVFNYCDSYVDGEPVMAKIIFDSFPCVIGAGPTFLRTTERKSLMHKLMKEAGLPCLDTVLITDVSDPNVRGQLEGLGLPLFVKVEAGYDSLGLTDRNVCHSVDDALAVSADMIKEHGPVVVQRYLDGREFTVPALHSRGYRPIEKILGKHKFYDSRAPDEQWRTLNAEEPDGIVQPLMDLAGRAYDAVLGDSYGRVDIRQDANTKELFVLEVNSVCSIAENSYFDLGVEACGLFFKDYMNMMIAAADARAAKFAAGDS